MDTEFNLLCWGYDNQYNRINDKPDGEFLMVSCGVYFSCALPKDEEGVRCWGYDGYQGITDQPMEGLFDYISTGVRSACALSANDNSILCWGYANGYPNMITNGANVYDTPVLDPNKHCENRIFLFASFRRFRRFLKIQNRHLN